MQYLSYVREFYLNFSVIMVAATPGGNPPASGPKMENGLFHSFASTKTRGCRQHCFAAVDFEGLILLLLISGQCQHFIPPESTRKPLVLWCFQGV